MSQLFPHIGAVILAAGKGTRMHSDTPKVLQLLLEEPMLGYVYDAVTPLLGDRLLTVVGHGSELVQEIFPERRHGFVQQAALLGTGHALQAAWPAVLQAGYEYVLVINGDTPLISVDALESLLTRSLEDMTDLSFISLTPPDAAAFGLVLRENGKLLGIIEAKDYNLSLYGPKPEEINAGIYCLRTTAVTDLLPLLRNTNKSGEFYITDLVALGLERGLKVEAFSSGDDAGLLGVNSPYELVQAEELLRRRIVEGCSRAGVILRSPDSIRIGPNVRIEPGADITGPCEIYGQSSIGAGTRIASHCRLDSAEVAEGARVHSFCHIEDASIGPRAVVGPYARLRPGAVMEEAAHVGNFVEMKKARLGKGAKANHLSYLGDAEIGAGANIGAGTITCNYDGVHKHRTVIGEKAFIGSNSALVAPVTVGNEALVGAGSVITKDVPDGHLALTRSPQLSRLRGLKPKGQG